MKPPLMLASVLALSLVIGGCNNAAQPDVQTTSRNVYVHYTYWAAGTGSNPYSANCGAGDAMIGWAFDRNTPLVKCAVMDEVTEGPLYNGIDSKLGVSPACDGDPAVGWGIAFPSFVTTLPCESIGRNVTADYVDGDGYADWGQEWFTWGGDSVYGHVCNRAGSVVTAFSYDQDLFVCAF